MARVLHNVIDTSKRNYYTCAIPPAQKRCSIRDMRFRLQKYRVDRGLTQAQVAERLGISQGLYNQLESGKRRMNETYLSQLAEIYDVSPTLLIIDPDREDPLYHELDEAFRRLSRSERKILVDSAKGILAGRPEQETQ